MSGQNKTFPYDSLDQQLLQSRKEKDRGNFKKAIEILELIQNALRNQEKAVNDSATLKELVEAARRNKAQKEFESAINRLEHAKTIFQEEIQFVMAALSRARVLTKGRKFAEAIRSLEQAKDQLANGSSSHNGLTSSETGCSTNGSGLAQTSIPAGRKAANRVPKGDSGTQAANVSVVIPCYNHAQYLPETVESVVEQTYQDFEIIIVNDGSTDNTREVAEGLIRKYSRHRIKLIQQPNQGFSASCNTGLEQSVGRYFMPMSADDLIRPTFIEKTVKCLDEHPELGFVYTCVEEFGHDPLPPYCMDYDFRLLCSHNIPHQSLIRKCVWEDVAGYDPELRGSYEDWVFWLSAGLKGWFGRLIPEPLFRFRKHKASLGTEMFAKDTELKLKIVRRFPELYSEATLEWARLFENHLSEPGDFRTNHRLALLFLDRDDWKAALPHLVRCAEQSPRDPSIVRLTGLAFLKNLSLKEAAAYLGKAVELDPLDSELHLYYGIAMLLLEKKREAIHAIEEATRLKPDWLLPYAFLTGIHFLIGEPEKARVLLKRVPGTSIELINLNDLCSISCDPAESAVRVSEVLESLILGQISYTPLSVLEPKAHLELVLRGGPGEPPSCNASSERRKGLRTNGRQPGLRSNGDRDINGTLIGIDSTLETVDTKPDANRAERLLNAARSEKETKNFENAINALEEIKQSYPEVRLATEVQDFDRLLTKGRTNKRAMKYLEAALTLEEAKLIMESSLPSDYATLLSLAAKQRSNTNFQAAIKTLEAVKARIDLRKSNGAASSGLQRLITSAREQNKVRQFQTAITALEAAKELFQGRSENNGHRNGYFNRLIEAGRTHRKKGEYPVAISRLEEAKTRIIDDNACH